MKGKFKVGDRVKCVSQGGGSKHIAGKYGVVKEVLRNSYYGVEFDEHIDGHCLNGTAKSGHGWNCEENILVKAESETIVIYRKGNDVIALDKANDKKAVARCNPEDTFDFETGARLALERLFEKPKYNARVVCVRAGTDQFTKGKIYEVIDGVLTDDYGCIYPREDIDDLNKRMISDFIEVKED